MSDDAPAILVVDDEIDICHNLADILGDLGYTVDVAQDAATALELVRRRRYAVILLDLMMPEMDGIALLGELKRAGASAAALLVTAYPNHPRVEEARGAGFWQVLAKPVDLPALLRRIDEAADLPLVLVVENDAALCRRLTDLLGEQGYRVEFAHDERAALEKLRHDVRVILLNVNLPDGDGASVVRRAREINPGAAVIVISGRHAEQEPRVQTMLTAGADAVVPKPFDIPRLIETLRQLTAGDGAARPGK